MTVVDLVIVSVRVVINPFTLIMHLHQVVLHASCHPEDPTHVELDGAAREFCRSKAAKSAPSGIADEICFTVNEEATVE
jgi:hypothetical protein